MQSGADREVEEVSGVFLLFFFHPVPHRDYSQGGFNLQQRTDVTVGSAFNDI